MIKYALHHKANKELVGFRTESNSGSEFCHEVSVILELNNEHTWFTKSAEQAEYVRCNSTKWYNADMQTPNHDFEADWLEVVKVETSDPVIMPVAVRIPSVRELCKARYALKEPRHWEYLEKEIDAGRVKNYSWWDLLEYLSGRAK